MNDSGCRIVADLAMGIDLVSSIGAYRHLQQVTSVTNKQTIKCREVSISRKVKLLLGSLLSCSELAKTCYPKVYCRDSMDTVVEFLKPYS